MTTEQPPQDPFTLASDDIAATTFLSLQLHPPLEADVSLFATTDRLKLKDEAYFVFYNQQASPKRELRLLPDPQEGQKRLALSLSALPSHVRRITVTLSAEEGLSELQRVELSLMGADQEAKATFSLPFSTSEQSVMVCEFAQVSGAWHLQATGTPFAGDLAGLLHHFGGATTEDSPSPVAETPTVEEPAPAPVTPAQIEQSLTIPISRLKPQDVEVSARLLEVARRIPTVIQQLQTEEATKHALVMPFIQALGYDVFNPLEVTPELTADVGVKKGEKVDYAILQDGKPIILLECKHHNVAPSLEHASQLYRYFSVTEARFAILTNGVTYRFYTDLEKPNTMDSRPFLEVNLLKIKEAELVELLKFAKHAFDQDNILSLASEMKYVKAIKQHLAQEFTEPSDEFIRLLTARVFEGRLTTGVRNRFALYTRKALNEFVAQLISDRLRDAFVAADPNQASSSEPDDQDSDDAGLVITTEEWQAFYIIRSILRENINYARVHLRKHQSYSSILLDNNRRKAIGRLYFSEKRLQLGIFDKADRQESRVTLDGLDDIFKHASRLLHTVKVLDAK
ncbi:type I restriction endonuclease [Deinococcus sp. QL22]|uniref:type I restriction endonuclease n=1 Tax=Deinococcus sp. QL22 TaxID=2939437 RepID=UPI0020182A61|nr:TerD family protein [Deinococcus sp. QL22]UQN06329.1 TerD family protein [Deinococcus sp. QL22]